MVFFGGLQGVLAEDWVLLLEMAVSGVFDIYRCFWYNMSNELKNPLFYRVSPLDIDTILWYNSSIYE